MVVVAPQAEIQVVADRQVGKCLEVGLRLDNKTQVVADRQVGKCLEVGLRLDNKTQVTTQVETQWEEVVPRVDIYQAETWVVAHRRPGTTWARSVVDQVCLQSVFKTDSL